MSKQIVLQHLDTMQLSPDLDEKYKCPVCLVALRDPLQTVCGHRFCRVCLTRSRGRSLFGKCPLDKTLFDPSQVFEDNAVRREVLSLTIKCDHHKDGCTWRGELRDRESHASRCAEAKVNCSNDCGHVCSKRLMPTHIVLCPLRMESCEKCGLTLLASELAKHHLLVCEQFPLPCTVCGQVELTRPNMVRHVDVIEGDCPMVIVKCQFEKLGCYFQEKRKNMNAHNMTSHEHHNELVMIKLRQQDHVITNLIEQYRQVVVSMKEQCSVIEEQGGILRLQGACIKELLQDDDGHLLWHIRLPTDKSTRLTSPALFIHGSGIKAKLILDLTSSLLNNGSPTVSVTIDGGGVAESGSRSFKGVCHLTIFSQSRLANDYSDHFAFSLSPIDQRTDDVGRQGLFGFMSTDQLYAGPYTKDGNIVLYAAIRRKAE